MLSFQTAVPYSIHTNDKHSGSCSSLKTNYRLDILKNPCYNVSNYNYKGR